MVRLKAVPRTGMKGSWPLFQFQYGSIKSRVHPVDWNGLLYFNSNMVRLKEFGLKLNILPPEYFNSNMVRLKEILHGQDCFRHCHFNSNMVRLKATPEPGIWQPLRISIPIWFD